jgi:hypothetical protein
MSAETDVTDVVVSNESEVEYSVDYEVSDEGGPPDYVFDEGSSDNPKPPIEHETLVFDGEPKILKPTDMRITLSGAPVEKSLFLVHSSVLSCVSFAFVSS